MPDRLHWQHETIRQVRRKINRHHRGGAQDERQGQVARRPANLTGDERHVVPGIGSKHGADLGETKCNHDCIPCGTVSRAVLGKDPRLGEIRMDHPRLATDQQPKGNHNSKRGHLGHRKHILDILAVTDALRVHPGEQPDKQHGYQLRGGERKGVVRSRELRRKDVDCLRYPGPQHTQVARKADTDGVDQAGLENEEERPAIKKRPKRRETFSQIDVLTTGRRHHGRELRIAERRSHGDEGGDPPGKQ